MNTNKVTGHIYKGERRFQKMTYKEAKRLQDKRGYQAMTRWELEEHIHHLEGIVEYSPDDSYWQESLELAREVLKEKGYAPEVDEEEVENSFLIWGF